MLKRSDQGQNLLYRSSVIQREKVDEEKRTVDVSFSSETPVERYYYGKEILLHGKRNVDMARLKSLGAALLGHNSQVIVGPLSNIRIEERRGRATIHFDDDDDGEKAFRKVKSGSLKGVSVGFIINRVRELRADEEWENPETKTKYEGPAVIATRWTPYEISLTPIPADATVGVNRDMAGIEFERSNNNPEGNQMEKAEIQKMIDDALKRSVGDIAAQTAQIVRETIKDEQRPRMNVTVEQSRDLLARAGAVGIECKAAVADLVNDGKTEPEILRYITDQHTAAHRTDTGDTGDLPGGTGVKPKPNNTLAGVRSFEGLEDDVFFRSIANPSTMPMQ